MSSFFVVRPDTAERTQCEDGRSLIFSFGNNMHELYLLAAQRKIDIA